MFFTSVFDKIEELFGLALKIAYPDTDCRNAEQGLETVTKKNDEMIAESWCYKNSIQVNGAAESGTFLYISTQKQVHIWYPWIDQAQVEMTWKN